MIVSWDWLKQYVKLDMTPAELAERLMMAGLNHEETHAIGDDLAIDLEVTSNRPDCLGHLGHRPRLPCLWDRALKIPLADPPDGATPVGQLSQVDVRIPATLPALHGPRHSGREASPPARSGWSSRLATVGIAAINNVVDVTNYVLMECGQPLHAFDLAKLGRPPDHRSPGPGRRKLSGHRSQDIRARPETMCVIADAQRAVGLGGVMGGAETEVTGQTERVVARSARFDPLSIRNTARKLNLHSDSSYRFERGLDPEGVDWASRRACELILELAGGELAKGSIDVGEQPSPRAPVTLRFGQLRRVLGIDVEPGVARRILTGWEIASCEPTKRASRWCRPRGAAI